MKKVSKSLGILLILVMVMTCFTGYAFGAVTASTIRLEQTQGKVSVVNQNKAQKSIKQGMKLVSGDQVITKASSYAYASLDATKALKMDSNSKIALRQKGSQNEILVSKGKVYFNVSKKLGKNEKMNIRTSTMIAGVRGTIGVVDRNSVEQSTLYVLEGKFDLPSVDHKTGMLTIVRINAGEKAVVKRYDAEFAAHTRVVEVVREELVEEEIPLFARVEIYGDGSAQKRIAATGKVSVNKLINGDLEGEFAAQQAGEVSREIEGEATYVINKNPDNAAGKDMAVLTTEYLNDVFNSAINGGGGDGTGEEGDGTDAAPPAGGGGGGAVPPPSGEDTGGTTDPGTVTPPPANSETVELEDGEIATRIGDETSTAYRITDAESGKDYVIPDINDPEHVYEIENEPVIGFEYYEAAGVKNLISSNGDILPLTEQYISDAAETVYAYVQNGKKCLATPEGKMIEDPAGSGIYVDAPSGFSLFSFGGFSLFADEPKYLGRDDVKYIFAGDKFYKMETYELGDYSIRLAVIDEGGRYYVEADEIEYLLASSEYGEYEYYRNDEDLYLLTEQGKLSGEEIGYDIVYYLEEKTAGCVTEKEPFYLLDYTEELYPAEQYYLNSSDGKYLSYFNSDYRSLIPTERGLIPFNTWDVDGETIAVTDDNMNLYSAEGEFTGHRCLNNDGSRSGYFYFTQEGNITGYIQNNGGTTVTIKTEQGVDVNGDIGSEIEIKNKTYLTRTGMSAEEQDGAYYISEGGALVEKANPENVIALDVRRSKGSENRILECEIDGSWYCMLPDSTDVYEANVYSYEGKTYREYMLPGMDDIVQVDGNGKMAEYMKLTSGDNVFCYNGRFITCVNTGELIDADKEADVNEYISIILFEAGGKKYGISSYEGEPQRILTGEPTEDSSCTLYYDGYTGCLVDGNIAEPVIDGNAVRYTLQYNDETERYKLIPRETYESIDLDGRTYKEYVFNFVADSARSYYLYLEDKQLLLKGYEYGYEEKVYYPLNDDFESDLSGYVYSHGMITSVDAEGNALFDQIWSSGGSVYISDNGIDYGTVAAGSLRDSIFRYTYNDEEYISINGGPLVKGVPCECDTSVSDSYDFIYYFELPDDEYEGAGYKGVLLIDKNSDSHRAYAVSEEGRTLHDNYLVNAENDKVTIYLPTEIMQINDNDYYNAHYTFPLIYLYKVGNKNFIYDSYIEELLAAEVTENGMIYRNTDSDSLAGYVYAYHGKYEVSPNGRMEEWQNYVLYRDADGKFHSTLARNVADQTDLTVYVTDSGYNLLYDYENPAIPCTVDSYDYQVYSFFNFFKKPDSNEGFLLQNRGNDDFYYVAMTNMNSVYTVEVSGTPRYVVIGTEDIAVLVDMRVFTSPESTVLLGEYTGEFGVSDVGKLTYKDGKITIDGTEYSVTEEGVIDDYSENGVGKKICMNKNAGWFYVEDYLS